MNNLYYSFRELKKSLLFKIIIILQLVISIILIYRINEIRIYESNKLNAMGKITTNKEVYQLVSEYNSLNEFINDNKINNKFSNFSDDIQEKYSLVTAVYGEVSLKKFNGIENFIDNDFKTLDLGKEYVSVNSLQCSPNFFDIFNIELSEGTFDEFSEFVELDNSQWDGHFIPVILGNLYKDKFNIGDILETENFKYKVVGFMKVNQFFLDKGIYHLTRVENLNSFIIAPIPKNIMIGNINNSFLILDNEKQEDFNFVKEYIDNLAEKHNVKISVTDQSDNIENFIRQLNNSINIKLLVIFFIIFFVVIGLIVVFINRITARKKEISVHITCGATINDICIRVFLEHFYLSSISIIISYCYLIVNNTSIITDIIPFQIILFFQSALLLSCIITLISLIPIYYIKKYSINYLIKGE